MKSSKFKKKFNNKDILMKPLSIKHFFLSILILSISVHVVFILPKLAKAQELPHGVQYETLFLKNEDKAWALIWLDIAQEYYTYARGGDASVGMPTTVYWRTIDNNSHNTVNSKLTIDGKIAQHAQYTPTVFYPKGMNRTDFYDSSKQISAYTGKIPIFILINNDFSSLSNDMHMEGQIRLLLCSQKHCLPVRIALKMPTGKNDFTPMTKEQKKLLHEVLSSKLTSEESFKASDTISLSFQQEMNTDSSSSQMVTHDTQNKAQPIEWNFSIRVFAEELEVSNLGKALMLGLLAGLILNLMPCVLPVLTLKASALLAISENGSERFRMFREHSLLFAAGILTQFILLAILLGTSELFWGEIFQNTYFVMFMLICIFVLALSMFGVFTLPMIDLKSGHNSSPRVQAYTSGFVATLLATPCSGPLLGGVLSFAFMQPTSILILIFIAVGMGMALPYILFAIKPRLAIFLPRPGMWMQHLERIVGFFLMATSIYLLSVLPEKKIFVALISLLFVAFLGWIWGKFANLHAPQWRRRTLSILFIIGIMGAVLYAAKPQAPKNIIWEDFVATNFQQDLGKKPMLVEFTADWCPNCKFVEQTVLTEENLLKYQKQYNLHFVRVDITHDNAEAEALMHALDSKSIPLTALFPQGLRAQSPILLRDIFSKKTLDKALKKAFDK